ncbi:PspC domain-containing protein [Nocardioides alcanivorans]|uniref:PspC domain-containing protein n=1 Tax=Nocardioides alcanivorans TaxID=2897352 RepID=UPI001F1DD5E6|nr:PspC domain-containing protein [Nocardioides alcanivorans]
MNDETRSPYRKRLTRSRHDKMLGGVCGGIASYTGFDVTLIRILMVAAAVFGLGTAVVFYLIAWVVMPQEG